MFGYVVVNKGDLRFREFDEYRGYYCGLCQMLKKGYGFSGQMTLSYDMTFLVMLLTSLYEPVDNREMKRCIAHPVRKHCCISNEYTEYVADMTILLSYYKCQDDWQDEKKVLKKIYGNILRGKSKKKRDFYREKETVIAENLRLLSEAEKRNEQDLDVVAGYFGNILAELFVIRNDEWSDNLRQIGYYLGKYIYIMDAYDDLEKDIKKGNYNPFTEKMCNTDSFDYLVKEILTIMAAECAREFEKLPLIENIDILRNILYSGIWSKYEIVQAKRSKG